MSGAAGSPGLYCYGPKFDYVASDIDPPERPAHPTFDLIADHVFPSSVSFHG